MLLSPTQSSFIGVPKLPDLFAPLSPLVNRRLPSRGLQKGVYDAVIDDVIDKMRQAFIDEGSDETVLSDLRDVRTIRCIA